MANVRLSDLSSAAHARVAGADPQPRRTATKRAKVRDISTAKPRKRAPRKPKP